jgi:hypothetical protein
VAEAGLGEVPWALVVCYVIFQLPLVVQSGAEPGVWLPSMDTSMMTWQRRRVVRGVRRGFGEQGRGFWVVWEVVTVVVGGSGTRIVVLWSVRCAQMNASACSGVTPFAGVLTVVGGCCLPG